MVRTRRIKAGMPAITYSSASKHDTNILIALEDHHKVLSYYSRIHKHSDTVRQVVAHHLKVSPDNCKLDKPKNWMRGSFNVCVPVFIDGRKTVLMRLPFPHRVGDGDEKIRCEAATHAWINKNCPSIRAPKLYGFGLSTGQTFTNAENLPLLPRYFHYFRCFMFDLIGYAPPTEYVPCRGLPFLSDIGSGYLLVQYIDQSEANMLSQVWEEKQHDDNLRVNLFKGLAQILLDLAKVPVPQIGSFIIDDNGFLMLCNRPLSNEVPLLESRDIPVDIPRDMTYSRVDSYVADILTYHDSRLQHQPNAVHDSLDGIIQVSALATMRSVASHFFERDLRPGPFLYTLHDLHGSTILVDKELNIQYIIDLEWACSQPIEMIHPPHWFAGQWVDTMDVDLYTSRHEEFVGILEDMERELSIFG